MSTKLKGICKYCKFNQTYASSGDEYCFMADYHSNDYGHFWRGNKCLHDENHAHKTNLFEPLNLENVSDLNKRFDEVCKQKHELEKREKELRDFVESIKKQLKV